MNRDIKFRIWDSTDERMDYDPDTHWSSPSDCLTINDAIADYETIMQFTGLSDKNGKEIYEGDIVRASKLDCEVFYNERFASFDLATTGNSVGFYSGADLEIIGNIHENKNLLDK